MLSLLLLYRTCEWHRGSLLLKYLPNIALVVCIVLAVVMPVFLIFFYAAAAAVVAFVVLKHH